ncbi:MAG: hypothetical protein AAF619_13695 [Pseudomonadota bacterium]
MPAAQIDRRHETPDDTARRMTDAIVTLSKYGIDPTAGRLITIGFSPRQVLQFGRGARMRAATLRSKKRRMPFAAIDCENDDVAEDAYARYSDLMVEHAKAPRRDLIRQVMDAYKAYLVYTVSPSEIPNMVAYLHADLAEALTGTADRRAEGLS